MILKKVIIHDTSQIFGTSAYSVCLNAVGIWGVLQIWNDQQLLHQTITYLVCKYFAVTIIMNMSIFSPIAFLLVYNSMWVSPLLSPFCALSSEDENLNASGIVLPALKSAERCLSHCFRKCSKSNTVSFQTVSAASQIFEDQECSLYLASCSTSMAEGKEGTINSVFWFTDISGITMWYMLTFSLPFCSITSCQNFYHLMYCYK